MHLISKTFCTRNLFTFFSLDEAPVVEPILSVYKEAARTGVHRTIHAAEASGSDAVERVSALCPPF